MLNDQPSNVYPSSATGFFIFAFDITTEILSLTFMLKLVGPSYVPFVLSFSTVIVYVFSSVSPPAILLYSAISVSVVVTSAVLSNTTPVSSSHLSNSYPSIVGIS